MLTALLVLQLAATAPATDPFEFFRPSVTIDAGERRRLDAGEAIARTLPAPDSEVAILAVVRVNIDGDRLVAWMRRVEELKKSSYVPGIGRFSNPPRLEDLAGLSLDDEDLSEIRSCRPGRCGLKLSPDEIASLQRAAAAAKDGWQDAVQQAFRCAMLTRAQAYLATVRIHPDTESFLYWSKERLSRKAIVSITHVTITRGESPGMPEVLVAGKGIYATHYLDASLGQTALVRGEAGSPGYLVYINRSEVDVLQGMFGGIIRWFMERQLKSEASGVLLGLRRRLESGEPGADHGT